MRKDAVVLEIRKKTAVVLAPDGRFMRIRNQGYHAGQRIATDDITPEKTRPVMRRTLLIAACLVLVLGSTALAASKYMAWSYADLEVGDVSVGYTLNYRNEVLRAESHSEAAESLLSAMEQIPYEPVDNAVERIMDAARGSRESAEEPEVAISVSSVLGGSGRVEKSVMEGIGRSMEKARPDEPPQPTGPPEESRMPDASQRQEDTPELPEAGKFEAANPAESPPEESHAPDASPKQEDAPDLPETGQPEAENQDDNPPELPPDQPMHFMPEEQAAPPDNGRQNGPDNSGNQPDHRQVMNEGPQRNEDMNGRMP